MVTASNDLDLSRAIWHASPARPDGLGCVEIADLGDYVAMRDSANPDGPVLVFTPFEWACFLDGVAKGEFRQLPQGT
jgi:hypothetical protein